MENFLWTNETQEELWEGVRPVPPGVNHCTRTSDQRCSRTGPLVVDGTINGALLWRLIHPLVWDLKLQNHRALINQVLGLQGIYFTSHWSLQNKLTISKVTKTESKAEICEVHSFSEHGSPSQ